MQEGEAHGRVRGSQAGSEEGREARLCILALLPPRCCRLLNPPLSLPRRDDVGDCGQLANEQRLARARQCRRRRRRPRLRVDA